MTDSLQVIEEGAFCSTSIEYLKTGKSLISIGENGFASCKNLKTVEIGDQVTSLGEYAFYSCYLLQNMIIGNGVQRIPSEFCYFCDNLISVTLGNAVNTLDAYCFQDCDKLRTIICKAEIPPMMNGAEHLFFDSAVFQNAMLYVPEGSIEAYKSAFVWENFQNILNIILGDVDGDGEVTIADANSVIDIVIMGGNSAHTRTPAADVNSDGEVSIADVNAIIEIILGKN